MSIDQDNIRVMNSKHKQGIKMDNLLIKVEDKDEFLFLDFQVWKDVRDTYVHKISKFEAVEDTVLGEEHYNKGDFVYAEVNDETPLYDPKDIEDGVYAIIEPSDIDWFNTFDDKREEVVEGKNWKKV